jgi:hypothetical protein
MGAEGFRRCEEAVAWTMAGRIVLLKPPHRTFVISTADIVTLAPARTFTSDAAIIFAQASGQHVTSCIDVRKYLTKRRPFARARHMHNAVPQ